MSGASRTRRPLRRWAPWAALAVVVAVALAVGSGGKAAPQDIHSRMLRLAAEIRCPTCQGQSAADSEAPTSQEIRTIITQRLQQGQSASQIKAYLVSRYGQGILLRPATHGISLIVWLLPLLALLAGLGGLAAAFRRWRARPVTAVTAEDRRLVDEALRRSAS